MRIALRLFAAAVAVAAGLALAGQPAGADTVVVTIGAGLDPRNLTVPAGTTVEWRNADGDRHRVRSADDGSFDFDSGNLEPGDSFAFTFSSAGSVSYLDDRDRSDTSYHGTITVTAAGSGGGGGGGTTPTPGPSPGAPGQPPPPPPPSAQSVSILDRSFSPGSIALAPGGTVTWTNTSDRDHTVTSTGGGATFDSGTMGGGATFRFTFPGEGSFSYRCDFHPEMTGVVSVSASSSSAPPPPPPPPPAAEAPPAAPAPAPSGATGPAPAAGRQPASSTVSIVDFAYRPASVSASVGDTITWVNNGTAPHTVTGGGLSSGRLNGGGRFSTVLNTAGTISYRCDFHPEMTGTVVVGNSQAPIAARAASSGAPAPGAAAAPGTAGAAPATPAATATAPSTASVGVEDFAFTPPSVTIASGGTVTWSFTGVAPHSVTGDGFDSGIVESGATFEHTFDEAGTYDYSCVVHPDMKGVVEVTGAPIAATDTGDGGGRGTTGSSSPASSAGSSDGPSPFLLYGVIGGGAILAATGVLLGGMRRFLAAFS